MKSNKALFSFDLQRFAEDPAPTPPGTTPPAATGTPPAATPTTDPAAASPGTTPAAGTPPADPGISHGLLSGETPPAAAAATTTPPADQTPPADPIQYADFTLPEGVQVDSAVLDEFKALGQKNNISQEAAQELVNLQTKFALAQQEKMINDFKATVEGWQQETVTALGATSKESLAVAAKGYREYASPELQKTLAEFGLNNKKEVVEHFIKLGNMVKDAKFVPGQENPTPEQKVNWFPNSTK